MRTVKLLKMKTTTSLKPNDRTNSQALGHKASLTRVIFFGTEDNSVKIVPSVLSLRKIKKKEVSPTKAAGQHPGQIWKGFEKLGTNEKC